MDTLNVRWSSKDSINLFKSLNVASLSDAFDFTDIDESINILPFCIFFSFCIQEVRKEKTKRKGEENDKEKEKGRHTSREAMKASILGNILTMKQFNFE